MKRIAFLVVAFVLSLNLCACACDNTAPATNPTTNTPTSQTDNTPSGTMTIPMPETNIPDPSVDPGNNTLLPDATSGDNTTGESGTTGTTGGNTNGQTGKNGMTGGMQ